MEILVALEVFFDEGRSRGGGLGRKKKKGFRIRLGIKLIIRLESGPGPGWANGSSKLDSKMKWAILFNPEPGLILFKNLC